MASVGSYDMLNTGTRLSVHCELPLHCNGQYRLTTFLAKRYAAHVSHMDLVGSTLLMQSALQI